jgi:hypothetical protein
MERLRVIGAITTRFLRVSEPSWKGEKSEVMGVLGLRVRVRPSARRPRMLDISGDGTSAFDRNALLHEEQRPRRQNGA